MFKPNASSMEEGGAETLAKERTMAHVPCVSTDNVWNGMYVLSAV